MNRRVYPLGSQPVTAPPFYGICQGAQPGILGPPPVPFQFWGSVNAFQPPPFPNFGSAPPVRSVTSPGHSATRMPMSIDYRPVRKPRSSTRNSPSAANGSFDQSLSGYSPGVMNTSSGIKVSKVESSSAFWATICSTSSHQSPSSATTSCSSLFASQQVNTEPSRRKDLSKLLMCFIY